MKPRADAHIHLFDGGYHTSFAGRPGVEIDEAALYCSFAEEHGIEKALIVGFEGGSWCAENNRFIESVARDLEWAVPLA